MKSIFLKALGILFASFVFFSCQDDNGVILQQAKLNGPDIKIYEGTEANARKSSVVLKLQKAGKLTKNKLRVLNSSDAMRGAEEELEINYGKVMETQDSYGNKHLTYEAINSQSPETFFYNLVVTEKEGKTKIVLVTYQMDESFAAEYAINKKMENFKGKISFTEIATDPDFPCNENPSVPIPVNPTNPGGGGGGSGGGGSGSGGNSGINPGYNNGYNQDLIDAQFLALAIAASVAEAQEWIEVSHSPRYFRIAPILSDPSNPCGGGLEIGILEPMIKGNPCVELNKFTNNLENTIALGDLQSKTNLSYENGYALTKNNTTNSYESPVEIPLDENDSGHLKMSDYVGGDYIGACHTHPNPNLGDYYPMFSSGDLRYLFFVASKHNSGGQPKNYSEYILTLTVPQGTFALKIKNVNKFYAAINGNYGDIKETLEKNYMKQYPEDNIDWMKKDLLDVLKNFDMGIGLYQYNGEDNDWSEIVHDLNPMSPNFGQLKNLPCN